MSRIRSVVNVDIIEAGKILVAFCGFNFAHIDRYYNVILFYVAKSISTFILLSFNN